MSEFLAEARVLVTPDTSKFAATLKAELAAIAKASAITIPVLAAPGSAQITKASKDLAVVQTLGAKSAAENAVATNHLTKAQNLNAAALAKLGGASEAALLSTTRLAATRAVLAETSGALVIAEKALDQALLSSNALLVDATLTTVALAEADRLLATENVKTAISENTLARATTHRAESQAFAARGAGATALSLLGVRGATLAANASFLAGAAALIVFAKSVGLAAKFEDELNVFRITASATAGEMERVSEAAKALGADITLPGVSAGDAAAAMTELAKAGLSVEDSLAGTRGVLQLATAAQIDNATATNITASALNAFGLAGTEAVRVADLLANAANEAQGGIGDMGQSLASVASVARQVGISLTDTVALLTLLAKNGIQGAAGGTVLRVALLRLVAPSAAAAEIIKQLGISIRDAQGNIRPDVFAQFAAATENLTNKQRDADAAIVFGTRGIRAQAILGREGAAGLNEMASAVEKQGTAAAVAGARTAGFTGKMEALKNSLENLGIEIGQATIPILGDLVIGLNKVVGAAGRAKEGVDDFLASLPGSSSDENQFGPFSSLPDLLKQAHAGLILLRQDSQEGGAGDFFESPRTSLAKFNAEIDKTRKDTPKVARSLSGLLKGLEVSPAVTLLRKFEDSLINTGAETDAFKKRLDAVERGIVALGRAPTEVEIQLLLDQGSLPRPEDILPVIPAKITFDGTQVKGEAKKAADTGADVVLDVLKATLSSDAGRAIGFGLFDGIAQGAEQAVPKIQAVAASAGDKIGAVIAVAQAAGDQGGELAGLRAREARQSAFLERLLARPQDEKTVQLVEQAAQNLDNTRSQIRSILDQQASDAESAKNDIIQARNKADQALLDSLGGEQGRAQNLILRAQNTESLKDDIKFAVVFRNILKQQIETVRKSVLDAQTRAAELRSLTTQLIKANQDIKNLRKKARDATRQDREDRLDRQDESVQLDIELAQITKNKSAEIKAHQRRIALLQQRIKNAKGHQLEIKRLKVEIARERAAIKDLKGEVDQRKNAFAELTFSFLQTQQGFAANLLGNLIPGGATGGLVGGSAAQGLSAPQFTPGTGVEKESAIASGRDRGIGVQGDTMIHVLRDIKRLLMNLNGRAGHPEARHQKATSGSAMDVM